MAYNAMNPTNSLVGGWAGNSWTTIDFVTTNQRFIVDLGDNKVVRKVVYNNWHSLGGSTERGAYESRIYGSSVNDSHTTTTYGNTTGLTLLSPSGSNATGWFTFDRHVNSDVADTKNFTVNNENAYRYYIFDIANSRDPVNNIGFRHLQLQTEDGFTPSLQADFEANLTTAYSGDCIQFTDLSTGTPTGWNWSFGDGHLSTIQNPENCYSNQGVYNVVLVVNKSGTSNTTVKSGYITIQVLPAPSNVSFSSSQLSWTGSGYPVIISSLANNTRMIFRNWSFGDGSIYTTTNASELSVIHNYTAAGNYTVTLSESNANSTVSHSSVVPVSVIWPNDWLVADFTGTPASGSAGLLVSFTDLSQVGNTTNLVYNWSFGDDGYSTAPYSDAFGDVNHVYAYLGTYTVKLSITNIVNSSTTTKINYITISNNQQTQTTFYSPHQVVFQILDSNRNAIAGTHISAHAIESTLPGGLSGALSTLQNAYGVPRETAEQMLSNTTEYSGTTDTAGYAAILMLSTIEYHVNVTDTTGAIQSVQVMPQDAYYQILTYNSTTENIFNQALNAQDVYTGQSVFNASFYKPNSSYGTMINYIYDASGQTTGANCWFKCVDNGTKWWNNKTWSAGSGMQTISMTVPIVPYQQWRWGCDTLA